MTCADVRERLSGFVDDELDPWASGEVARHVAGCADCARALDGLRALSQRVRADVPVHRAPDALRARLRQELGPRASAGAAVAMPPMRRPAFGRWRGLAAAAAAVLLVSVGFVAGRLPGGGDATQALAHEAVAAHVRALLPGHLADVASTDQHTVKPWFAGRLDFSPEVTDFAAQGYPLVGGRLDDLGGRPVAALVYMRRKHVVNVFEWPAGAGADAGAARGLTRLPDERGYHVVRATGGAMTRWLVSDLNADELEQFARLLSDTRP